MIKFSVDFDIGEAQNLLNLIDVAVKAQGMGVAGMAVPLANKIKAAGDAAVAAKFTADQQSAAAANGSISAKPADDGEQPTVN